MLTVLDFPFVRRHATGVTLGAFILVAVGLSLAPVPEWLVPLDLLQSEDPAHAFVAALLKQPDAIPLPDQLADQLQAEDPLPPDEVPPPPEVRASTVSAPRTTWQMPERPDVDRYAGRLGLVADPIENPCVAPGEGGACERRALSRFFGALERVERGDPGAVARIIHFGDSLIASDKISDRARLRLQQRFGSAGRGFLMAKRFNQFQRGQRSGRGSEGWELDVITASLKSLEDRHFGFSGASFTSKKSGETLTFEPIDESRFMRLYYLAHPEGTPLEVKADGALIETLETRADMAEGREYALELPEGTERLVLESTGPGARVYGLSLESSGSGVIWSTLGLPGATSEVWLRPDEAEAARLLSNREPSLAIIMLGGNDGLMLAKKRATAEELERDAAAFVDRVQAALPGADCMLVTPLEAVRAKGGGRLIPKPEVEVILEILGRVAEVKGCALWDMYTSMGGKGSLKKWVSARLMLGDLIHPRSRGSDLLGELFAESIMRAYDERGGASVEASPADAGVIDAADAGGSAEDAGTSKKRRKQRRRRRRRAPR